MLNVPCGICDQVSCDGFCADFIDIMFTEWTADEMEYMHLIVMHPSYEA